jgi:HNH endonuclease
MPRVLQPATCPACDGEFLPNRSNPGLLVTTQVYCSRQCSAGKRSARRSLVPGVASKHRTRWVLGKPRSVPSMPLPRMCEQCGKVYTPKRQEDNRNRFCSRKCKSKARRQPLTERSCLFCGEAFMPVRNAYAAFCSRTCNQRARRDAYVAPRRVLKTDIGERDRWRCRICGGQVAKWRRFPDPLSASVDHIVLAALGGTNDPANLRLAHLGCNQGRGGWIRGRDAAGGAVPG